MYSSLSRPTARRAHLQAKRIVSTPPLLTNAVPSHAVATFGGELVSAPNEFRFASTGVLPLPRANAQRRVCCHNSRTALPRVSGQQKASGQQTFKSPTFRCRNGNVRCESVGVVVCKAAWSSQPCALRWLRVRAFTRGLVIASWRDGLSHSPLADGPGSATIFPRVASFD